MSDLISRQEAIDALHDEIVKRRISEDTNDDGALDEFDTEAILRRLPAAQPEQRWTPCTERLPDTSDKYLVTALEGIRRMVTLASYHPRTKQWSLAGRAAYWKVTAWMPLPAAYREGEQE